MSRGDRREAIYLDDHDRETFLRTLSEVYERTGWVIHAYVLMGNHYHLLLETPEPNLVAGMKWFQGTYTQRFNGRHRLPGHLFQGRYKALMIDPEEPEYFVRVSTYIHLNPFRASLAGRPDQPLGLYRWSSYPSYLQPRRRRPKWLYTERVLEGLHIEQDQARGRRLYEEYIEACMSSYRKTKGKGELNEEWKPIRRGWCLGAEDFRERMLEKLDGVLTKGQRESYHGSSKRAHDERAAEEMLRRGLAVLELTVDEVRDLKNVDLRKQALAWMVKTRSVVTHEWVSKRLGMGHRMNVTRALQRMQQSDRSVRRIRRKLERMLHEAA